MSEMETDIGIAIDAPGPLADLAATLRIAEEDLLRMVLGLVCRARSALT